MATARACLEGALAADARHAPAALALAHLLRHTGGPADLALAAAHAESALRARPDYVSAWCAAAPRRSSSSPQTGIGGAFCGHAARTARLHVGLPVPRQRVCGPHASGGNSSMCHVAGAPCA